MWQFVRSPKERETAFACDGYASDRNCYAAADAARFTMTIENEPSVENPRTGQITALSMLACLRGLVSTLKVGT